MIILRILLYMSYVNRWIIHWYAFFLMLLILMQLSLHQTIYLSEIRTVNFSQAPEWYVLYSKFISAEACLFTFTQCNKYFLNELFKYFLLVFSRLYTRCYFKYTQFPCRTRQVLYYTNKLSVCNNYNETCVIIYETFYRSLFANMNIFVINYNEDIHIRKYNKDIHIHKKWSKKCLVYYNCGISL